MSFDPFKAVHVHTHGDRTISTDTIGLADEENLLIHACPFSASRQKIRVTSPEGELLFRADFDPTLVWNVRATVLAWNGLANAHPGPLARQALVFANGGRIPHQFLPFRSYYDGEEPGILFYEDPQTGHEGGDSGEIDFRVALEFSDLDTANYSGEESAGGWTLFLPGFVPEEPEDPVTNEWIELPIQTPGILLAGALAGLLADIFRGLDYFGSAPLTAKLYNGDPNGGGTAVSDAVSLPVWTTLETPTVELARLKNHVVVEWLATAAARTVTHIVFARNGITVCSKALSSAIVLPALTGLRAPVASLSLQLKWFTSGAVTATPAALALRHLCGDATTGLISVETSVTVNCYGWDPNDGGTLLDSFAVGRDSLSWEIAQNRASNTGYIGTNAAPMPDGWLTEYITVTMAGIAMPLYQNFVSGNIPTDPGDAIEINAEVITQEIL